jgi:hypothetical protein
MKPGSMIALGSRMELRSFSASCCATLRRSGPSSRPTPSSLWQLMHTLAKTVFPRAASPGSFSAGLNFSTTAARVALVESAKTFSARLAMFFFGCFINRARVAASADLASGRFSSASVHASFESSVSRICTRSAGVRWSQPSSKNCSPPCGCSFETSEHLRRRSRQTAGVGVFARPHFGKCAYIDALRPAALSPFPMLAIRGQQGQRFHRRSRLDRLRSLLQPRRHFFDRFTRLGIRDLFRESRQREVFLVQNGQKLLQALLRIHRVTSAAMAFSFFVAKAQRRSIANDLVLSARAQTRSRCGSTELNAAPCSGEPGSALFSTSASKSPAQSNFSSPSVQASWRRTLASWSFTSFASAFWSATPRRPSIRASRPFEGLFTTWADRIIKSHPKRTCNRH